ncbi:long-chain fatty acid--CoA ligase [candidate division KSB1 bacterium]|nr:AMP-binding protein [candidate division KSB1 bacterium]RQW03451.1 MAG: long-chain fatty acid--CoA ligase [candidate division KSB1 bacterium]
MIQERYIAMLEGAIIKNWNMPAFTNYGGETCTYSQLAHKIMWLHYIFKHSGIKKGDKIALVGKNSINWAITFLASLSYGAAVVPILPDFKPDDIHHIVNHSDAVMFFAAQGIFDGLDENKMPNLDAIFSLDDFSLLHKKKHNIPHVIAKSDQDYLEKFDNQLTYDKFKLPEIQNSDLAAIVYTSGTTGFSKGVMLPHNSISANIRYAHQHMPLKNGDKIVSFMPLAHSYGCAFEFLFPLSLGCHITFLTKIPSPKIIIKAFQEIKPQLVLAVPLIIEKIYKKQIQPTISSGMIKYLIKLPGISTVIYNKIRRKLIDAFGGQFFEIVIGGAALNPEVELFLKRINFPFTNGYGMTECGPLISYDSWRTSKPFSVGKVVDTLEIRIDSADPHHIVGEIMVKGDNVMSGYYKNDQATKTTMTEDGWLRTGDLGLLDNDGYIYIKGRSKNMILGASGQNIYPEEIEAILNNLPLVNESVVMKKNNKLIALIYPDYELVDAEQMNEARLMELIEENRKVLNAKLPLYSAISKIEIYPEEFEKTPTKKIKRFLYNV